MSVDSVHCHANWAKSLGGVSFPLLADFHPKGAMADAYGLYLAGDGHTDRATVIIDAGGTVRHASSVTPSGSRDIGALAALCEEVDRAWGRSLPTAETPPGIEADAVLYVKNGCTFSANVLAARTNLHLDRALPVRNITEDAAAFADLERIAGKTQAPCLVRGAAPMFESIDIIRHLAARTTGW